ncbi:MAG: hypothetical protein GWO24_37585, partial [Akkermansiaceae bacterium]|nr:hypothetical protein [Akkermansiaceae bacterium]
LGGWKKVEGLTFGYTDGGRTRMAVFETMLRAGEELEIPQGNWTGGVLLVREE